ITVWPGGAAQPATSTLNFAPGETRANGAIVAVGADGTLGVSSSADAHVIIDVTGAFTSTERARAGRLVPLLPHRALDTRATGGRAGGQLDDGRHVERWLRDGASRSHRPPADIDHHE